VPIPDPKRVAAAYLERQGHAKTAGEVIFKKDRGGDVSQWAYADTPPSERQIPKDFNYSPKHQKPLAKVLRTTLAALGHALSGYNRFAKIKSSRVSPDGSLGGRGYIQKIPDMRKQYMNCIEALSALADTIHDEINGPHWSVISRQEEDDEKADVKALLGDVEMIKQDPQQWAEGELAEEFGDKERELDAPETMDPDDWDIWKDETEVETTVPNIMAETPGIQRVARNQTARDVRLELAIPRIAYRWSVKKNADQLPGGLADDRKPSDFDPEQLKKGIEVEKEHVGDDVAKAREIAMDHLVEDSKYYDKLEAIEGGRH